MRQLFAALMVGAVLAFTTSAALAADPVEGVVTQIFTTSSNHGTYLIAVNGTPYEVPLDFYLGLHIGETVQFNGTNWTVAR